MKKILYMVAVSVLFTGCNFLDFDESQGISQEEAYGYFSNVKMLGNAAYRSLPVDYGVLGGALRESATDNAVYTWSSSSVYDVYQNVWSPINLIDNQWSNYYSVIYDINSFLENYNEETLKRFEWDSNYKDDINQARMSLKEVIVLRALYYFELVKRYGDVPLITKTLTLEEANNQKKTAASDVLHFVMEQCESVAEELPLSHNDFYGETGRVTRGAALAIRARAALYAASPLFIGDGNAFEAWKLAASAANEVISMNYYSLPSITSDFYYSENGGNEMLKSPQLIFETRQNASYTFERKNLPIGFATDTNTGNTPTQNLVDDYEMKDGTNFDWSNPEHVANIYFDADGNPTRDPRLYKNVLCNGSTFMNESIDSYEGGRFGAPIEGATMTGYYLKKLMNETVSLDPTKLVSKAHHYPNYRYAEVLLNYAEAMNEWQGPDYTDSEHSLSARDAINQVRMAAGMPEVVANGQDEFRQKVRKERRIELAFEDHRFWDIRRWKIGNVVEKIYGVEIHKNGESFSYTRKLVQNRIWNDKMYLYPIPMNETYLNKNLTQNPGWNE